MNILAKAEWTGRNTGLKSTGSYGIHSNENNSRYWINVMRFIPALRKIRNDIEKSVAIETKREKSYFSPCS